ncbi:ATPase [Microlunatus elymi]|uniref:ATPase n=1 Tax=Microlunatus elymi TaxID=2596828 RepID=A0A516PU04_9ACTN|nr:SRPBCC domain-containing protein [Microlunatus elymi]QDP94684.1 ATPase [Microlunatus elymi]
MNNAVQEATEIDPLDRIEKNIKINAGPEKVFEIVSRPGWWINDGTEIDPEPDLRQEGDVTVVSSPKLGEYRMQTVASDPPHYVAIRWHHQLPDDGIKRSTLVEFRLEPQPDGVLLSVVESGFSKLQKPREDWLADRAGNTEGWELELGLVRALVEAS